MRAEAFIARYRELYDNESLRLVPLYYYTHPNVLEFYLRTQTPQISLHNVDDFQTIDVLFWMWHPDSKIDKRILKRTYDQGNRSLLEQYLVDDWRAAYQGKYKKDAPAETVAAFREKISSARLERLTDNNLLLLWK